MISAAVARLYLGSPTADDPKLTAIIERATATLERSLGFYLGAVAERQALVTARGCLFVLADDVIEPTAETPIVVETLDADWAWETIATTYYRRSGRKFIHRTGWPEGVDAIRVTYQGGYATDGGPAELRDLVLRLVALRYRDSASDGVQSETLSDYSYSLKDDVKLAADWADAVRAYARNLPI